MRRNPSAEKKKKTKKMRNKKKLLSDGNVQSLLHGLEPDAAVLEVGTCLGIVVPTVLYTARYRLLALGKGEIRTIG